MVKELDPQLLLQGYAAGIFPMSDSRDAADLFWVEPRNRAILPLEGFHLSRSLARVLRGGRFEVTLDRAFGAVVQACADREETWINSTIEHAVLALHRQGQAHSVECWRDGRLVGGLYGVRLGGAFFGESMFSAETDASKVALAWLVARLKAGRFTLLDCQFMTSHLASLGAITIPRNDYVSLLSAATGAGAGRARAGSGVDLRAREAEPEPDLFALDALLEAAVVSAGGAGGSAPAGKVIAQLLGHTS